MSLSLKRAQHIGGFTLLELIVVIAIIALLAVLVIRSGGEPTGSKRRVTATTMDAIRSGLERYYTEFGEYPEPVNPDETIEIMPGKVYRVGGAKCLYQALRGDGFDAIKQDQGKGPPQSDGQIGADEISFAIIKEMPEGAWRKMGAHYFLVDAFGRPFQYIKADTEKKNTINSTYDLWSFADDDKHTLARSKDTESKPGLDAKWIKNW
ncbi:MAG: prepilin-type N-terminal cleavage/methylation domain-containing protein [Verrucomicrobiaceae bacterium]